MADNSYLFGPELLGNEEVRFRLWAPAAPGVDLEIAGDGRWPMQPMDKGWWQHTARAGKAARYRFRIGDIAIPDPAARAQCGDVHGWSIVLDPASYAWRAGSWCGRPWEECVIYEVHAGVMGGYRALGGHLPRLKETGFTAVELMPVADFPGGRNWGYDGVLLFAPDEAYGSPDDLKALVDQAHELGMMMIMDVVYNHFGPDGNYLHLYAPQFFAADTHTPWGASINLKDDMVRRFFSENARYWLEEFRFDGLRLDAVHALRDDGWLVELAGELRAAIPRQVHLIVENEDNDARLLRMGFSAQWNDDLHHVLHVMLTGEHHGYYGDYIQDCTKKLARALAQGFVYQGEPSAYRQGRPRGTQSAGLPPTRFIAFLQNHDQVGNRALGDRLIRLAPEPALKAAIALVLLAPQIPMVFMGEEVGAVEPFLYFTDHSDGLAQQVREGRRNEFRAFPEFADEETRSRIPDPNARETFERSRPDFGNARAGEFQKFYADLLALRRRHIVPWLKGTTSSGAEAIGDKAVQATWRLGNDAILTLACNLGTEPVGADLPQGAPLWGKRGPRGLDGHSTCLWIEP